MLKLCFLCAFQLLIIAAFAQSISIQQVSEQVSKDNLKHNLYYLASDQLEGRLMASHGDTLASIFIADWFLKNNVAAPYNNGKNYFQAITARKRISTKETITIASKAFARWNGWAMVDRENIKRPDIPVVFAGYGLDDPLYDDFKTIDVRDKAVIVLPRQPKKNPTDTSLQFSKSTRFASKVATLREKGALLVLYYDNIFQEDAERNRKEDSTKGQYINPNDTGLPLPFILISEERINDILASDRTNIKFLQDSINKRLQPASFDVTRKLGIDVELHLQEVHAPNVIGLIYGTDTAAGNITVTAHHDHLGKYGNAIYHGASDDASGTAALMEIAALMNDAVHKGLRPKRSIVFISTTAEEGGNLGSAFYIEHPLFPIQKTIADINLDLLGRIDDEYMNKTDSDNYVFALMKDSKDKYINNALEKAEKISSLKINMNYKSVPTDIMLKGWDTDSFIGRNIPCISFFTGATKDALHTTDTADKINYTLLTKQTQLAFLTLWNLAND